MPGRPAKPVGQDRLRQITEIPAIQVSQCFVRFITDRVTTVIPNLSLAALFVLDEPLGLVPLFTLGPPEPSGSYRLSNRLVVCNVFKKLRGRKCRDGRALVMREVAGDENGCSKSQRTGNLQGILEIAERHFDCQTSRFCRDRRDFNKLQ